MCKGCGGCLLPPLQRLTEGWLTRQVEPQRQRAADNQKLAESTAGELVFRQSQRTKKTLCSQLIVSKTDDKSLNEDWSKAYLTKQPTRPSTSGGSRLA